MRRRRNRAQMVAIDQINVTPLLDLTFLLLIAFMITMPLMEYGTSIKAPKMNSDKLPENNYISITVTANYDASNAKITWKKITGATGYELQCSVNGGEFETIQTLSALSFVHEGLAPGNKYTYRLRAISADERTSSDYCAEKSATIKVGKPNLTIALSESGKPQLSWETVEGAVSYQIYYATSKSSKYKLVETTGEQTYIYEAASKGKTCYFKVRAVDINGTTGDYSSVKSIKSK